MAIDTRRKGAGQPIRLPIEVKGIWNEDVVLDLERQLVKKYMNDLQASYGLYVVLWPDQESWTEDDQQNKRRAARQARTAPDLFENAKAKINAPGRHVDILHLDISFRRPAQLAEEPI